MVNKENMKMAFAEAGYPNARVDERKDGSVWVTILPAEDGVPHRVCWQAFVVCKATNLPCYTCWYNFWGLLKCKAVGQYIEDCGAYDGNIE